jgi:CMP-2-keto-3-deoxyoctulosonic acid synthetase
MKLSNTNIGKMQRMESIEQFKLIENGIAIKTIEVTDDGNSLNTTYDLKRIRRVLLSDQKQAKILESTLNLK